MIGVVATVQVQPEKAAEFERVALELEAQVKANEPGCLLYRMTKSRSAPDTYTNLELYRGQADLDLHVATDYFQAALGRMSACVSGTPQVDFLDTLQD